MSSLHSTMICFDNSDYMRNEDYRPSRLHSQMDSVQMLCRSKIRAHPQNEVGLMTISNDVEVLSTLTNNVGSILTKLSMIHPKGNLNFLTGLRIAQLVLRNRQQKDHRTRIIAFVGSPMRETPEQLVALSKKFKKEKVHVDVIVMGAYPENQEKLATFIKHLNGSEAAENENASHLVVVPPGADVSTQLMTSPLLTNETTAGTVRSPEFMDEDDADLALALRISLEEQRALEAEQRRQQQPSPPPSKKEKKSKSKIETPPPEVRNNQQPNAIQMPNFDAMTEEEMIAFALNLSAQEAQQNPEPSKEGKKSKKEEKKK